MSSNWRLTGNGRSFGMTTLDEIDAMLATAAASYFGRRLPADALEAAQRTRAQQAALASDENLPLEIRLQAAFQPFNRAARPWRYLQLFVARWPPFRDPAVAARVLVEQWSDFDDIPHTLFVDLVFPHLSPEALTSAMNAEARKFLDDIPDPFVAWSGQDEEAAPGLSWATDPTTAEGFARGRVIENPRPVVYQARIAKADVAFACADQSERAVILRRPPAKRKATTLEFDQTLVKRKRGRPTNAELVRDSAYAEYLRRIKIGSPPPGGWPLVQTELSKRVPKVRDVGRPYDVDLSAPFEQQFRVKFVERFIANAAWLLKFAKDRYRKELGVRNYVPAHDTDKMLEQILSRLLPEFLRLAETLSDRFDQRFLDQVAALKRMVGDEDDKLYLRDDRANLKRKIIVRARNLDQIILNRKRITKVRKPFKKR
jgi:hypothetical protein